MTDLVQAAGSFVARLHGARVQVREGHLYPADDAVVKAFPAKFRAPIIRSTAAPKPPKPAAAVRRTAPRKAPASKSR